MKTVSFDQKLEVSYAIPLWLRDEQMRQNIARPIPRVQPEEGRTDSIAVVCFGPSLKETWGQVKGFRYVLSCSGSHKFLVERGIVPTWHIEVDPRPHKVELIGPPQRTTEYLLASTCHADVFEHLKDSNVKLWHVFDATEDGQRLIPNGEWGLTGGCDVGLRALTMAAFLGFRDLHIFGMDHSSGSGEEPPIQRHADAHPKSGKEFLRCEHNGKHYWTTPAMLAACQQVWHELDMIPGIKATFYGEGLCQAVAKDHVRKQSESKLANVVAFSNPELISAEYTHLNAEMHRVNLAYGVGGGKHAETVLKLAKSIESQSVLDYGCGKGYLGKALPFPIWEYDPAIPEKSSAPRPADLVVCTDVLEHIEPDKLPFVLDHLSRVTRKVGFLVIHTGPALKTLPDGRNTHLIQHGRIWWKRELRKFFNVARIFEVGKELWVLVAPKAKRTMKMNEAVVA